jgi:hypothetical protein
MKREEQSMSAEALAAHGAVMTSDRAELPDDEVWIPATLLARVQGEHAAEIAEATRLHAALVTAHAALARMAALDSECEHIGGAPETCPGLEPCPWCELRAAEKAARKALGE